MDVTQNIKKFKFENNMHEVHNNILKTCIR